MFLPDLAAECRLGDGRTEVTLVVGVVVRIGLELVRSVEGASRRSEEDQPGQDEQADERVRLPDLLDEEREDPEGDADRIDEEDGVPMRQPEIEQAVVDVRTVRA